MCHQRGHIGAWSHRQFTFQEGMRHCVCTVNPRGKLPGMCQERAVFRHGGRNDFLRGVLEHQTECRGPNLKTSTSIWHPSPSLSHIPLYLYWCFPVLKWVTSINFLFVHYDVRCYHSNLRARHRSGIGKHNDRSQLSKFFVPLIHAFMSLRKYSIHLSRWNFFQSRAPPKSLQ